MAAFVIPPAEQLAEVNQIAQLSWSLTTEVRLLSALAILAPPDNLAALVSKEATYTGYAPIPFTTVPVPYLDLAQGGVSLTSQNFPFAVGATPTVTNTIFGFWINNPIITPVNVSLIVNFATTVPMNIFGDALNLQVSLNYFGPNGIIVTVNGQLN